MLHRAISWHRTCDNVRMNRRRGFAILPAAMRGCVSVGNGWLISRTLPAAFMVVALAGCSGLGAKKERGANRSQRLSGELSQADRRFSPAIADQPARVSRRSHFAAHPDADRRQPALHGLRAVPRQRSGQDQSGDLFCRYDFAICRRHARAMRQRLPTRRLPSLPQHCRQGNSVIPTNFRDASEYRRSDRGRRPDRVDAGRRPWPPRSALHAGRAERSPGISAENGTDQRPLHGNLSPHGAGAENPCRRLAARLSDGRLYHSDADAAAAAASAVSIGCAGARRIFAR